MTSLSKPSLREFLDSNRFAAYAYSYPHKTAYRAFSPVALREVWEQEPKHSLFAYVHVPFCEMRCGFCNLFTRIERDDEQHSLFLDALERQIKASARALLPASFARMAVGGGTPTILSASNLQRLFDMVESHLGASPADMPCSVETSPATATPERLTLLKERGVSRVSMGVQSFLEAETRAMGRPQQQRELFQALEATREQDFPVWNLDFIYGLPTQTVESWLFSLRKALEWQPNEIFLYPLYIRPLTGLGRRGAERGNSQLDLYRAGRDFLRANGFQQVSMRMFARHEGSSQAPLYCCQRDGMVGLGAGARSYTSQLHYSTDYAVASNNVKAILDGYIGSTEREFESANYGFWLNEDERKRRFLIQSLLNVEGLDYAFYEREFGTSARDEWGLDDLCDLGLAEEAEGVLRLTDAGFERSDELGPFFASDVVRQQMEGFTLR